MYWNDHAFLPVTRDLDTFIDRLFGPGTFRGSGESMATFAPKVDVHEDEKAITVVAEVPGISRDDIKLTLADGKLTLSGEKKSRTEKNLGKLHHTEIQEGAFRRTFAVPPEIDEENVDASFVDGVLTIKLPKTAKAKEKQKTITIK